MRITVGRGGAFAQHDHRGSRGSRFANAAIVRSLVLGGAVFTFATIAGALLSGAAPGGSGTTAMTELVAAVSSSDREATSPGMVDPRDAMFARSMIYTGASGLAVSIAGMVIVVRRRLHW